MKDDLIKAMLRIIDNIVTRYGAKTMLPARISKLDELFFSLQSTSRNYFDDSEDRNCSEAMDALQKTVERRSLAIARNNAKTKAKSIKFWNLTEPCPEKPEKPEKPPNNTTKNTMPEKPSNLTEHPQVTPKPEKIEPQRPAVVSKPEPNTEEKFEKSEFGTGAGSLVAWTIITLVSSVMLFLAVLTVYKSIPPSSVHPHKFDEESPTATPPSSISEFLTSSTFPTSSVVMTSFNVQDVTSSQNYDLYLAPKT